MSIRVLDAQWHIGHQYEMLKFPFVEWSWLTQYKRPTYSHALRGDLSSKIRYVTHYEPGKFDVALLHLDQECLNPSAWSRGKGVLYREMNSVIRDIPKIVIMHGTPFHAEAVPPYNDTEWLVDRLSKIIGGNTLVVNSAEASRQWRAGVVVVHGMEPTEWFDLPKMPRVITTLSPNGMSAYYDRALLEDVTSALRRRDIHLCHLGKDYIPDSWDSYRSMIGSSLVYFNPTRESPMPRARTEAMFSGCCVVTTPYQDADSFIEHGINGYLVHREPDMIADLITSLLKNPDRAMYIGQNGKKTAMERFHWNRFASDWHQLLLSAINASST